MRSPRHIAVLLTLATAGCTGRDVVAKVGKTEIKKADVEGFMGGRSARAQGDPLTALEDRALLAEAARRAGLEDSPEVQSRLAAARREILAQAELNKALSTGTDEVALRERYQKEKAALTARQVHVAHIVLRLPPDAPAEKRVAAQTKINALYAKILDGASFPELAEKESEDPITAKKGGDLGPIREGQVDPRFFEAAVQLKKDGTSKPIATPFGLHILRALEDPKDVTPSFEEVRGRLAAEARREAETELLQKLRKEIPIREWRDRMPALDAGVAGTAPRKGEGS
jgi:parvulin-like peptidyl-prolyl isomerase